MKGLAICILPAILAALPMTGAVAQTAPASTAAETLTFVEEVQLSPRLREITLRTPLLVSKMLGPLPGNPTGQTKVRVLLPEGYDPKGSRRYPVLYLYHGGGGNQTEWTTPASKGDAEGLTKGLPLIVVMPEGGMAGGYSDWHNGGAGGPPQWKTYHLDRLIPWIDARYRTVASRNGRATAGLSMGGGGLRYAALRPDRIGATAAFSGDIDILQPASDWIGMGAPIARMIWGDRKTEEVRWRGANGPDLAGNLGNTDVAIFTGDTGRPEGVYILQGSTAMHERLDRLGIRNRFTLYPGMTHSWPTWNRALTDWLPGLMRHFAGAGRAARPRSFSYSTIAPDYALYDWRVEMQRPVVEFSALEVRDGRHFSIVGSGEATVTTPVIGRPNTAMRVSMIDRAQPESKGTTATLRTDAAGRLSLPVRLGPANRFQQYSAAADAAATGGAPDPAPFRTVNNGSRFFRVDVSLSPAGR